MKAEAQLFTSPAGEGSFLPFTQSSNQNRVAEPKNAAIFEKGGEWGDPGARITTTAPGPTLVTTEQ